MAGSQNGAVEWRTRPTGWLSATYFVHGSYPVLRDCIVQQSVKFRDLADNAFHQLYTLLPTYLGSYTSHTVSSHLESTPEGGIARNGL